MEHRLLRIALAGAVIAIAAVALLFARPPAPAQPQAADLSLSQYPEQAGSALPAAHPSTSAEPAPLPGCALRFSFAPAAKTVAPGGSVQYAITLANRGSQACENASFSVYYADNETFVSSDMPSAADGYYWKAGTLAPGASYAVRVSTKEDSASGLSQIENEACATADNSQDICADNVIFVGANSPAEEAPATPVGSAWGSAFRAREFGTWLWDYPDRMTPAYEKQALAAAAENGFNAVYLTIDDYLAVAALPDGANKTARQTAYFASLAQFVGIASSYGIAVDVEGGANDWGNPDTRWKGYALIDFVQAYNAAHPSAAVRGLQYDVESYLSPGYEDDKAGTLQAFVDFIDESAKRMALQNPKVRFSVVIPHFYDDEVAWTPRISYAGKSEYAFTALLDALEQKPGSALIVMAYRNFFAGDNGIEQIAQTEVKEAASKNYATKIIIAQETGNVPPAYVTFYGLGKSDLFDALSAIEQAFSGYPSFGGLAVHYLDPFLKLK